MSQDTSFDPATKAGGSAAGQAYHAEMEQAAMAQALGGASAPKANIEARASTRKKLGGRVRLTFNVGAPTDAKMIDMSVTGVCLLVEQMVHAKTPCTLACNIFHNGKAYLFSLRAIAVYSVLASGQGFKVGFQFGAHDASTAAQIEALMR